MIAELKVMHFKKIGVLFWTCGTLLLLFITSFKYEVIIDQIINREYKQT